MLHIFKPLLVKPDVQALTGCCHPNVFALKPEHHLPNVMTSFPSEIMLGLAFPVLLEVA